MTIDTSILELFASSTMKDFYIKASLYFLSKTIFKSKIHKIAYKNHYVQCKTESTLDKIKSFMFYAIFFVPYIGWMISIFLFLASLLSEIDAEDIASSNCYEKSEVD